MERRINKKCELYMQTFKDDIKSWGNANEISSHPEFSQLMQYIYDYHNFNIEKSDFQKRKRIKNIVPQYDRCNAKRANEEQCTRRKKTDIDFCGTHIKGVPHGKVQIEEKMQCLVLNKLEVFVQDIQGIHYYIDISNNVYKTEDIINNSKNPTIIAQYIKNHKGEYTIPSLGIY